MNYLKEAFDSLQQLLTLIKEKEISDEKTEKLLEVLDSALQDYDVALTQLEQNHIEH